MYLGSYRDIFVFLRHGGTIRGKVQDTTYRRPPITEGGLEVPVRLIFSHGDAEILQKMKRFVTEQQTLSEAVIEEDVDQDEQ